MKIATGVTIAVLLLVAAVHVYWARGGTWPGSDRTDLARRVVGRDEFPANRDTYIVVGLLIVAAVLVGAVGGWDLPVADGLVRIGAWGVFSVLALRGVGGFIVSAVAKVRGSTNPFIDHNLRYYSPLVSILALGVLATLIG